MTKICRMCSGSGIIERGDVAYECECALVRRIAVSMEAYVRKADVRKEHLELPILKMVKSNIFAISSWHDMKAIIKAVMIANYKLFVKVTSDREIRDVYVGSKSRTAKGGSDEDGQIYNNLEDLVNAPNLLIVRLNEMTSRNRAAAGALEEAVSYRVDRDKPTWLYSNTEKPFTLGSHAYSASVADMIRCNFPAVRIPAILPPPGPDFLENAPIALVSSDIGNRPPAIRLEPRPASSQLMTDVATSAPASAVRASPGLPERPEPSRAYSQPADRPKGRIRPSEDDDAPSGLSIYGSGIGAKKSFGKGR